MADGKTNQEIFDIDTDGLEPAWTKLLAVLPGSKQREAGDRVSEPHNRSSAVRTLRSGA